MDKRSAWRSTAALISFVLCALSWELTGAMFVGRWLFGPDWFGPHREWAAFAVSVALSVFHTLVGRPLMQKHCQPGDSPNRSLTAGQAIAVIVLMVCAGAFGTWLFCQGPENTIRAR
jgi:hypothetical protein